SHFVVAAKSGTRANGREQPFLAQILRQRASDEFVRGCRLRPRRSARSSTSTRPAANGPSAPCSPRIPESFGVAPVPRIPSAAAGMPIPVPVTAAPILTGAATQSRRLRPSRRDKVDGGPRRTERWLAVVGLPAGGGSNL